MADKIGTLSPGMQADLIAVEGDPPERHHGDETVVFVMKASKQKY